MIREYYHANLSTQMIHDEKDKVLYVDYPILGGIDETDVHLISSIRHIEYSEK